MANFGAIKNNVGNRVGDTSTTFATQIGTFVNQRYKDILRRTNWNVIKSSYVISAATGQSEYFLPSNFGKELYVWDSVQLVDIPFISFEKLEQEYTDLKNTSGQVESYSVFNSTDTTGATSARTKVLKFWRTPSVSACFEVPYTMYAADLSGDTDELILDCERAVEYGAASDAWTTKRQFAKAQYLEELYEKEIQYLIWGANNQPNQIPMMNPLALDRDMGI